MSYFLAWDCSQPLADVSLLEKKKNHLRLLANKSWTHSVFKSTHSDRLPVEIDTLLKSKGLHLRELKALAVGAGPGRFTGVRTAITIGKALSFSLKIPVYSVNSLKILSEEFYGKSKVRLVSLYAFKNQVYFAEFYSHTEKFSVLSFAQWQKKLENLLVSLGQEKLVCISDMEEFFSLKTHLRERIVFKKPKPSAFNLFKIVLREKLQAQNWSDLKACYLRSAI